MKKNTIYYRIPDEYYYRIHFVRPRFKSRIESVLLYMAGECCKIPKCSCDEYSKRYLEAISMYPGNIDKTDKTWNNWRTEIPALFSFYIEDKDSNTTETSKMAKFLYENQNLIQFLRLFLLSFQFPGGHLKPHDLEDVIHNDIRFKPAKKIIEVLMAGNKILSAKENNKEMSLSAEETTYCVFNDLRVTSGKVTAVEIAKNILDNRKKHLKYYNANDPHIQSLKGKPRTKKDVVRYANDILDYMVTANLLDVHHGYYHLKPNELSAIKTFASDNTWFKGYDKYYGKENIPTPTLAKIEPLWFEYVNNSMRPDIFRTDVSSILKDDSEVEVVFDDRIKDVIASDDKTTKDIGNLGEAIIVGHEKMRLKINGYEKYVRLVQIADTPTYHPGFDIDSFEADGTENHRYIEVKTTISKREIKLFGFHMSPNEWSAASTSREHYCVYRLMISDKSQTLYILRNPVKLYKTDMIEAMPRDGMEITFDDSNFEKTEILIWKK